MVRRLESEGQKCGERLARISAVVVSCPGGGCFISRQKHRDPEGVGPLQAYFESRGDTELGYDLAVRIVRTRREGAKATKLLLHRTSRLQVRYYVFGPHSLSISRGPILMAIHKYYEGGIVSCLPLPGITFVTSVQLMNRKRVLSGLPLTHITGYILTHTGHSRQLGMLQ
jgi:hypothetical protein